MKARLALTVFIVLAAAFLTYLRATEDLLPVRVATHFDIHGCPNGWMTREGIVRFMALFGIGVPLIMMLAFSSPRFVPVRFVNLPNREHWLTGERRDESLSWLSRMGIWFAAVMLLFFGAIHHLVILANQVQPPRLDAVPLCITVGIFLACELALALRIMLRFSKPTSASA